MGGTNWQQFHDTFAKLLPLLGSRDDLNYLIGAMQGELASSHVFVFGGEDLAPGGQSASLLGVDYELDKSSGRYRFGKIYGGDNSRPDYRSPLTTPSVEVKEGDYLLSVDAKELKAPTNPDSVFVGVGPTVTLVVASSVDGARRTVVVQPLRSEFHVREQAWIASNRDLVNRLSSGKIGYLYLSDFDELGTLQFMRQFYAQTNKKALIVDERWNGGGSTSQWVLERLRRSADGGFVNRSGAVETLPDAVMAGPKIALTNEFSASDGDHFAYFFRKSGLGKLIGKRTWGGVRGIGSGPELLDGGRITIPHDALIGVNGEWLIENHGVEPDIEVDEPIGEEETQKDVQLLTPIRLLMQDLHHSPIPVKSFPLKKYPRRRQK
jgi:tricorn protease